jgi:small subunit ribosomal protein S21
VNYTVPKVHIKENEPLEKALRRFKKKIEREGTIREVKARKHYEKPSVKKRRKIREARKKKRRY